MCGIAGFCNWRKNLQEAPTYWRNILEAMHESLAHRGGDASGIYLREHAGLSHARLSIRDIEGGVQPMVRTACGNEWHFRLCHRACAHHGKWYFQRNARSAAGSFSAHIAGQFHG